MRFAYVIAHKPTVFDQMIYQLVEVARLFAHPAFWIAQAMTVAMKLMGALTGDWIAVLAPAATAILICMGTVLYYLSILWGAFFWDAYQTWSTNKKEIAA